MVTDIFEKQWKETVERYEERIAYLREQLRIANDTTHTEGARADRALQISSEFEEESGRVGAANVQLVQAIRQATAEIEAALAEGLRLDVPLREVARRVRETALAALKKAVGQ